MAAGMDVKTLTSEAPPRAARPRMKEVVSMIFGRRKKLTSSRTCLRDWMNTLPSRYSTRSLFEEMRCTGVI